MEGGVIAIKQISLAWHSCTQAGATPPRRGPGPRTHTICPFINKTYVNTSSACTPAHTCVRWIRRYLPPLLQTLERRLFFSLSLSLSPHYLVSAGKKPSSHLFSTPSLAVYTSRPLHCVFLHTIYCRVSARGGPNRLQLHNDLSVRVPLRCCCCCCCCRFHTISRANYTRQLRWFAELHQHRLASVSTLYAC